MFKFALFLLITLSLVMFILPIFYTVSPYELDPNKILLAPSFEHIFGTDRLGRDIFARVLQGGQTSLIIGFLAASFSSLLGLIIGITAGYFKGYVDKTITVIIDLFLTFPTFFLLLGSDSARRRLLQQMHDQRRAGFHQRKGRPRQSGR